MDTANVAGKCPVLHAEHRQNATGSVANRHWWPHQPNLKILHQNPPASNPLGAAFDYAAAFRSLDLDAVMGDIHALMTDSQAWWPADYGHYGPLFIRLAWHSAGTYRIGDGRGGAASGTIRFAPLNSWPDNANLDKARMLLWPVKKKYGRSLSWADLIILTGNCALESMGLRTFGFAGGREDVWEPEEDIYWGPESEWLGDERYSGDRELANPLGAVQMGLIYVNPEGPNGTPDPLAAARDIRETFSRMAMNDEETVALVAGGHTFGKAHGAADPAAHVGPEPEGARLEEMGRGWRNRFGSGHGADTVTSGLEGAWTPTPTRWDDSFFATLFGHEWELTRSPAGAQQWTPVDAPAPGSVPDAHATDRRHAPMMLTTDLALRMDPVYEPISRRFWDNHAEFEDAFARAWFKLTHRDLGPHGRGLGRLVPAEPLPWQDPVPAVDHALIDAAATADLKERLLASGLTTAELVRVAWASAATWRGTDRRGGANGARLRLAPQKDWAVNDPAELARVLDVLAGIRSAFNAAAGGGMRVSLADLVVLAGTAAVERAAGIEVPFTPGRTDATAEQTDVDSFAVLEPRSDGFRNFHDPACPRPATDMLVDRAHMLTLSVPEMTVLVGGMRTLGANTGGSADGVLTDRPGSLSQDFLVNLLDLSLEWAPVGESGRRFEGRVRATGEPRWTATDVDLIFAANSQLRAVAEVYAADDAAAAFRRDFVAAWAKVMDLDRTG